MRWDEAMKILDGINAATRGDQVLEDLKQELVAKAVAYARLRTDWALAEPVERKGMDGVRTAAHNAFIDACDILSRNLGGRGRENSWRERLGDDRKEIGDFACLVHCLLGISAR